MIICRLFGPSGEEFIQNPAYLYFNRCVNYAADGLRVVFQMAKFDVGYNYIEVFMDDTRIFEGIIDSISSKNSGDSKTTSIVARSLVAGALDCEAEPRKYETMFLSGAYELYMRPYGLTLQSGGFNPEVTDFIVDKGLSCYGAFEKYFFYTHFYFYIEGNVIHVAQRTASKTVVVSQTNGIPYKSIALKSQPNQTVSRIYLRDSGGAYNEPEYTPYQTYAYFSKARYMIPQENNMFAAQKKAQGTFKSSIQNALSVSATLLGYHDFKLGDYVLFSDVSSIENTKFVVNSITIKTDKGNVYTEINAMKHIPE